MSTDFSLKRPNSIKAESIQYIANLLDDGFSFAPLSPVNRLILNVTKRIPICRTISLNMTFYL
jgi:hypothetical protein